MQNQGSFAKEVQFHDCCRKQYLVKWAPQPDTAAAAEISTKKAMMSKACTQVYDHIKTEVIQKVRLSNENDKKLLLR